MKIVSVKLRRPSVDGRTQLAIPRQCLPNKEKFDVVVGEIINPGHFYLQRGSEYDRLNRMMDEMDLHYEPKVEKYVKEVKENKVSIPPPTFSVGDYVAAVWTTDQQWYRGQVQAVKEDKYQVFLFDYGDSLCVGEPYIWPLHTKFSLLPKQAIKAKLSGILPPRAYEEASACSWPLSATRRMKQLTEDSHTSSLDILVIDRGEEVLGVWLLDHQGEGVNEILVKEGFAQADVENDQLLQEFEREENKTEEEEWEEESKVLDKLHEDILSIDEKDATELDIELLSRRTARLEMKYNNK